MRVLFSEVDLFQLAAGNPDLDAALANAIKKANLSGVDLLVMHMLMMGYSQAEIARHMEYSKMAITKAVQRTRKKMGPYLKKELGAMARHAPKLDPVPDDGDFDSGDFEEDPAVPTDDFFRDLERRAKR